MGRLEEEGGQTGPHEESHLTTLEEVKKEKTTIYKQMTTSADNSLKTSWPRREKNGSITDVCTGNNPLTLVYATDL